MSYLRQLKRETHALLAGLGDSPDEVAESLWKAGIRGVPRDNRTCAVALYVSAVMGSEPAIRSVSVGHCSIAVTVVKPTDLRPAGRLLIQLPKPVRRFVAAFDDRRYPQVVAGQAPGSGPVAPLRHGTAPTEPPIVSNVL
jgi:hypothetical protein